MSEQAASVARAFTGEDVVGGDGQHGPSDVKEELRQRHQSANRFSNDLDATLLWQCLCSSSSLRRA
eukprot:4204044-Lingulodinium_polyedra.AAC.1